VGREDEWKQQVIGGASLLPFLERGEAGDARDIAQGVARVGEVRYVLSSGSAGEVRREDIPRLALAYYNTPFLSGGRSPGGIDATGLVQNVYRQAGVYLPRDLKGQLGVGASCFFLEEALPGDLLFFGDESGVSHVGIAWEGDRVIHASGRVRVDRVDHHGIFNDQIKRYTHVLKAIKRLA
jgi:cell wall-associated NlpC family hydrolase